MNLAKRLRKIAEDKPKRDEKARLRGYKFRYKEIVRICREIAEDGNTSYDWHDSRFQDKEKVDYVCEMLRKKGFQAFMVYNDGTTNTPADHIRISWGATDKE